MGIEEIVGTLAEVQENAAGIEGWPAQGKMSRKLVVGDVLGIDLVHPRTGQILLPARTVLNEAFLFRIEVLGMTTLALQSVDHGVQLGVGRLSEAPELFDFDTFLAAKSAILRLEGVARAYGRTKEADKIDPSAIHELLTDFIQTLVSRIEAIPYGRFLDLRYFDAYLFSHPINLATLTLAMGLALDYDRPRLFALGTAAIMADLGKYMLTDEILFKAPPLTAEEQQIVRRHVDLGADFASLFPWARGPIVDIVGSHHERFDGSGYPGGLPGEYLSQEAQLVGLADVYDAMVSDLPYRKRIDTGVAYRVLASQGGKQWDPEIVGAFTRVVAPYPVNTLVRLDNGESALVVAVNSEDIFRPVVRLGEQEIDLAKGGDRRVAGSIIRRRFYRSPVDLPIEACLDGRNLFPAQLVDLSLNGMSLTTKDLVPEPGMGIELLLPGQLKRSSLRIKSRVVWSRRSDAKTVQFGVALTELSPTTKGSLLEAIWAGRSGRS